MIRIGRNTLILGAVIVTVTVALIVYIFAGKQEKGKPGDIAESFLDAYYVLIDLDKAKGLSEGLAKTKIERQIEAIKKMRLANKNQSKVSYRLLNERSIGDRKMAFSFELSIDPRGGKVFRRVVFLHLRRRDNRWRVQAFRENNPS